MNKGTSSIKLDEDKIKVLRQYLEKQLEPICAADPQVLATYILALLRKDKSADELEQDCVEQLEDFLKEDTKKFVTQLFEFLKDLENNLSLLESPPPQSPPPKQEKQDEEDRDVDHKHARREQDREEKKRRQEEEDGKKYDSDHQAKRRRDEESNEKYSPIRHDKYQEERRYDRRDRREEFEERDMRDRSRYRRNDFERRERHGHHFDRNRYRVNRQKPRCKDYEERGYCMRGAQCPFDHERHPDSPPPVPLSDQTAPIPVLDSSLDQPEVDEFSHPKRKYQDDRVIESYDPERASYNPPFIPNTMNWSPYNRGGNRLPTRNYNGRGPRGRNGRGYVEYGANVVLGSPGVNYSELPLSMPLELQALPQQGNESDIINTATINPIGNIGANSGFVGRDNGERSRIGEERNSEKKFFKSKPRDLLVITNIPNELNTIDCLNEHFKKFGTVVNIQVQPHLNRAYVQYSSYSEALKLFRSPEAVLGNRFIKVFWADKFKEFSGMGNVEKANNKQGEKPPTIKETQKESQQQQQQQQYHYEEKKKEKAEKMKVIKDLQMQKEELRKKNKSNKRVNYLNNYQRNSNI